VIELKHIKIGVIALLLFGIVFALTGIVCADQGVNATPETQSLGTTTTADVVGLAMETDAGAWTLTYDPPRSTSELNVFTGYVGFSDSHPGTATELQEISNELTANGGFIITTPSSGQIYISQLVVPSTMLNQNLPSGPISSGFATYGSLGNFIDPSPTKTPGIYSENGIHTGVLDPGQIQYTTAYDANIVAQAGHTVLTKSMNIDTRNKVLGQSNINAQTGLTYIATDDGGNVVGLENLMLDGAGNTTSASDRMLCPFAASIASVIPAYCNIVQSGSKFDLTVGSVTTTANDKFVSNDASLPVTLNYNINVKPYGTTQGQIPAIGSTSAYIKAHIQEARGANVSKAEDLTYSEASSATGTITAFNKLMSYSSQVTGSSAMVMHTITPIGSDISPSTPVTVPDGGSATFFQTQTAQSSSISPFVEYYWSVDGKPYETYQNSYTFTNVVADHTISRGI